MSVWTGVSGRLFEGKSPPSNHLVNWVYELHAYNCSPVNVSVNMPGTLRQNGIHYMETTITITVLDIIHCPVFYSNYDVSETTFCHVFRWNLLNWAQQREPYWCSGDTLALFIELNWIGSTLKRRQNPVTETSYLKQKTGRTIFIIAIVTLTYQRHKPTDRRHLLGS
jgi:hypothetical protein